MKRIVYALLKRTAQFFRFGFRLEKISRNSAYAPVFPNATYSPWLIDEDFKKVFEKIKTHTLVDVYRCFELWSLVKESSKVPGAIIEIGAWRGGTGALIAYRAQLLELESTVYICDTFEGIVKAGKNDSSFRDGDLSNASVEDVKYLEKRLNLRNIKILKGIFPDETSHQVEDNQFRLCHIDVDVYESAKEIVDWVWDRMPIGGVIVYDDYGFESCNGIAKFVNEEKYKSDRLVTHNLNGHAVVVKIR